MKRRIIIIDFYWTRDRDPRIPLGHASLVAALCDQIGIEVRSVIVAVNSHQNQSDDVVRDIMREAKDLDPNQVDIALGAYVWGEELLQAVLRKLREGGFRGRIILGGPQVSYSGPGLENLYPEVDIFVRGYGEHALRSLASTSCHQTIAGVHWAGTPDLQTCTIVDLKALPSPWLNGTISLQNNQFIRWETQRGCPFRCAFCQHREPGHKLHQRALSLRRIESEIELFCRADVRKIAVLDPTFNMASHAVRVLEHFASLGFGGHLSLQCRAESVNDEFLAVASGLDVSLEFGLQTIHPGEGRVIRRINHIERVGRTLSHVRNLNIQHEVSLIFGLPLQTLESFEASINWCLMRGVPTIKAFPLVLLIQAPGNFA